MLLKALLAALAVGQLTTTPDAVQAQAAAAPTSVRVVPPTHRLTLDTTRLRPARLSYRTSVVKDSVASFSGEMQVVIADAQYAGAPAWLLAQSGMQGVAMATDSLLVSRAELRPLHWTASRGVSRIAVEFTTDTIFGAMSSPLGRQNIVMPNRGDLLVNVAAVDLVLAALPLDIGWTDSASVLVVDAGGSVTATATLAVDGEERVLAPAGEYDCWVVSLETERGSARYWVSKDARVVVRSEQVLPQLGGALLTRELLAVDSTTVPG